MDCEEAANIMKYNYETQAYLAYARAVDFANAVDIMEHSSMHLMIPQIVNAAFSCELILKATIIMEKKNPVAFKEHRLDSLFSMLCQCTQEQIIADASIFDWDTFMSESSNAFVEWRYLHEKDETAVVSIPDMQRLFYTLKKHYEENYPIAETITEKAQADSDVWEKFDEN